LLLGRMSCRHAPAHARRRAAGVTTRGALYTVTRCSPDTVALGCSCCWATGSVVGSARQGLRYYQFRRLRRWRQANEIRPTRVVAAPVLTARAHANSASRAATTSTYRHVVVQMPTNDVRGLPERDGINASAPPAATYATFRQGFTRVMRRRHAYGCLLLRAAAMRMASARERCEHKSGRQAAPCRRSVRYAAPQRCQKGVRKMLPEYQIVA